MNQKTAKQINKAAQRLTLVIMQQQRNKSLTWDQVCNREKKELKKVWYATPKKDRHQLRGTICTRI